MHKIGHSYNTSIEKLKQLKIFSRMLATTSKAIMMAVLTVIQLLQLHNGCLCVGLDSKIMNL